jgi:uncharacterized damage-inducible protein DinB
VIPEVENYWQRLANLHRQITTLVSDLPEEALNWQPFERLDEPVANSLAGLASHVAGAEHFWIGEVIGRRPVTRDRDAEFVTQVSDPAELVTRLAQTLSQSREILQALGETDLADTRSVRGETVPVRWALLHVVDHCALHLGHMQLTYQLWQGGQSIQAPRWFQRLPGRK